MEAIVILFTLWEIFSFYSYKGEFEQKRKEKRKGGKR